MICTKQYRILLSLLLAALLLCGCGTVPAAESTPAPAGKTVVVSDVVGFLNALAPDTTIEIDAEELALDSAPDYGFFYSDGTYFWENLGGGEYALSIRDIEGLTIRSARENGTLVTTGTTSANVISFRGCRALTVEGLTIGHRGEPGICCGDVLFFDGCEDVLVRCCDLFGCGVTAVSAWMCTRLTLEKCTLRDCSAAAMAFTRCTNVQARDCAVLRCGNGYDVPAIGVVGCNGFALINSTVRDCLSSCLLDEVNSSSVCLLGCEATGSKFSDALFRIMDGGVTVSGCSLADNDFSKCYSNENCFAVTGSGQALTSFADFVRMEHKPYTGEYIGPAPYVTPSDIWDDSYTTDGDIGYVTPSSIAPPPAPVWEGERTEIHAKTVDELLAAIAPHTTVYLDAKEFDLSTASNYGGKGGAYYDWDETYDGPQLMLHDLDDFALVGGGMGITLLSAVPRYANVLYFVNCRNISLSDMTLGHRIEPGSCAGNVVELSLCTGVKVDRCGLFGCGVIGISAGNCADLLVNASNIYDCSYLGAYLENVEDAVFTGCSVTDCGGEFGFNGFYLNGCSRVFFDQEPLFDGNYVIPVP